MPQSGEKTHFGFQQVALGDKQARVDDVFHSVARRYDLMNDLMSGGLHRAWKSTLVSALNPPKARGSPLVRPRSIRDRLRSLTWPAARATWPFGQSMQAAPTCR